MAEEDNEVLDWGGEDDVVSLGDEDERYTLELPAPTSQNVSSATPSVVAAPATPPRSFSPLPSDHDSSLSTPDKTSPAPVFHPGLSPEPSEPAPTSTPQANHKLTILPRMTHALPPKPQTANIPYVPPSDPSIVEATAMASRPKKPDTPSHNLKQGDHHDHIGPLPTPWEVGISRANEVYYVNGSNGKTTWVRPSSTPVPTSSDPPPPLSHDDRHYRPSEDRYAAGSGRRYEQSVDAPESRHSRHYSSAPGRSPTRGRDDSRSPSPQGRDTRARGGHRPARGRASNKVNGSQKEHTSTDLPKDEDRHWVPSPAASVVQTRNTRRQNRTQPSSMIDRALDPGPEEAVQPPPQRETSARGHNREKDHTYTSSHYPNHGISAPRSVTPPLFKDDRVISDTKLDEVQSRDVLVERRRSPGPAIDPDPLAPTRRERNTRFGPGHSSVATSGRNGLPMKPTTLPEDRLRESRRVNPERQHERRTNQDRRYEDTVPEAPGYSAPASRSPVITRDSDRLRAPPSNGDRDKTLPIKSETSGLPTRKRQPLPPQEAEFRGLGRSKSAVYSEPAPQRARETPRSTATTFHGREKAEKVTDVPPPRPYPTREDAREVRYKHPPPSARNTVAADYERDYVRDQEHAGVRHRQHVNDQMDTDRNYDMSVDAPPVHDSRGGYSDRERDPPSKPRAMQVSPATSINPYPTTGPLSSAPAPADRYRGRPSPPHLSMPDSRRDVDVRPSPGVWPERREERAYTHPERAPGREPRGRPAPASSANSIPIGARRSFSTAEVPTPNEYPPTVPNERYERPQYPVNDIPTRQARNYEGEHTRSYPEPEPVPEARQLHPRVLRNDPYTQATPDGSGPQERREEAEPTPRGPLPNPQTENSLRQRQSRFSSTSRNPRFDHEQAPSLPPSKTRPTSYDTSSRGQYPDQPSVRDTAPLLPSREASLASSQWDRPPSFHESTLRDTEYHDPPAHREGLTHFQRIDVDSLPSRQAPGRTDLHNAPVGERYQRNEIEPEEQVRTAQPPPRTGNRRDSPYSPELRRAPAVDVSHDDIERSGRIKWDSAGVAFESPPRSERPRMLNERISILPPPPPPPEGRGGRKQLQGMRPDNGYIGEPDAFEPRIPERVDVRQDNYVRLPAKTFEQRLDPADRLPIQRGSLLSRISRGGNDPPPPPQSLRDRVQAGLKRGRDDMVRDQFTEGSFDADDGEPDSAIAKKRKRRTRRRGGPP